MRAVRATRRKFSVQDARGAIAVFGRWHYKGQPILYCASSLSLAVLEQRVNSVTFDEIRQDFHYSEIDLEGMEVERVSEEYFKEDWTGNFRITQEFGTNWSKSGRSPILRVRSAILPVEWNYLINTAHPDFARVRFSEHRPIPLDTRL